jgi:hypothetical protein
MAYSSGVSSRESRIALFWSLLVTLALVILIVAGSRNLSHFDAALVAYTFGSLFAAAGITYRYSLWLQRPPTALYWRRGWRVFFKQKHRSRNIQIWFKRVLGEFALNNFIWKRSWTRGLTHMLLMWGCILAAAITFPLVFGWFSFESLPDKIDSYRMLIFGFPTMTFASASVFGFLIFHGLVWASFLVIAGVMLAMRRRMRDEGAVALQLFAEDFLPLILLFAVSITGLLLTVSYTWLKGYGYDFLALLHAVTVIFTLLWLPFGKFFHIFQRPAQLGVEFYKDVASREEPERCRRCGHAFASEMHISDLMRVERELGYRYEAEEHGIGHYQRICPPCRRAMFALAQGRLKRKDDIPPTDWARPAMPVYANRALSEGPLGVEDQRNFHP